MDPLIFDLNDSTCKINFLEETAGNYFITVSTEDTLKRIPLFLDAEDVWESKRMLKEPP
jgi:hypothetical protein